MDGVQGLRGERVRGVLLDEVAARRPLKRLATRSGPTPASSKPSTRAIVLRSLLQVGVAFLPIMNRLFRTAPEVAAGLAIGGWKRPAMCLTQPAAAQGVQPLIAMSANTSKPPSTRPPKPPQSLEQRVHHKDEVGHLEGEALEATVGAVAGAVVGALAGPVGAAAGAAVGGAVGVALARQIRRADHEAAEHERDLEEGLTEPLPDEAPEPPMAGISAEALQRELDEGRPDEAQKTTK